MECVSCHVAINRAYSDRTFRQRASSACSPQFHLCSPTCKIVRLDYYDFLGSGALPWLSRVVCSLMRHRQVPRLPSLGKTSTRDQRRVILELEQALRKWIFVGTVQTICHRLLPVVDVHFVRCTSSRLGRMSGMSARQIRP